MLCPVVDTTFHHNKGAAISRGQELTAISIPTGDPAKPNKSDSINLDPANACACQLFMPRSPQDGESLVAHGAVIDTKLDTTVVQQHSIASPPTPACLPGRGKALPRPSGRDVTSRRTTTLCIAHLVDRYQASSSATPKGRRLDERCVMSSPSEVWAIQASPPRYPRQLNGTRAVSQRSRPSHRTNSGAPLNLRAATCSSKVEVRCRLKRVKGCERQRTVLHNSPARRL